MSENKTNGIGLSVLMNILLGLGVVALGTTLFLSKTKEQQVEQVMSKEAKELAIIKTIQEFGGKVVSISDSPVNGLNEVVMEPTQISYITDDGKYVFAGALIDTVNKKNLTDEKMEEITRIKWEDLPKEGYFKSGNGPIEIAMFADPNCGYCKKIEKDLHGNTELTVRVYPVALLGQDSVKKVETVLCSDNQKEIWGNWMLNNVPLPEVDLDACSTDKKGLLASNMEFAGKNGITGTPTTILPNGKRIPGALPKEQFMNEVKNNLK